MSDDIRVWRGVSARIVGEPFAWAKADKIIPEFSKLRKELITEWKKLAAEKIRNPQLLQRFQQAMKVVSPEATNNGFQLEFHLQGMWGQALEQGWAPIGTTWEEGIGQYDGLAHDMRPWLLAGSTDGYRFIRITNSVSRSTPLGASQSPFEYLVQRMSEAQRPYAQRTAGSKYYFPTSSGKTSTQAVAQRIKRATGIITKAADDAYAPNWKDQGSQITGNAFKGSRGSAVIGVGNHATQMLNRAFVNTAKKGTGGGNTLSTIRTVTKDTSKGNWFSKGFAPANTFDDISELAFESLKDAFTPK